MIKWIDEANPETRKKNDLKENDFKDDLLNKEVVNKIDIHRKKDPEAVKKALRDRKFTLS